MNSDKNKLIEALAALAYSIAKADGDIQNSEKRLFKNIIRKEFNDDSWIAEQRFDLLDSAIAPTMAKAYEDALLAIKHNLSLFDKAMSVKFINVIENIADAFQGTDDEETEFIEKMKADFDKLLESNQSAN